MMEKHVTVPIIVETMTDGVRRTINFETPVCIIQSDDDPGDMGEPRQWSDERVTYVVVPPWEAWGVERLREAAQAYLDATNGCQNVNHARLALRAALASEPQP